MHILPNVADFLEVLITFYILLILFVLSFIKPDWVIYKYS